MPNPCTYELEQRTLGDVRLEALTILFETLYFSSLKTEEAQPITCYVVYLNPEDPDPNPPRNPSKDRWVFVRFGEAIPLTMSSLVKLAKASDPRTSSFVVYPDSQERLCVWGLIDQGNRHHDFVNYDAESGYERPGLFQASIIGLGHLVAYIGFEKIAELQTNTLFGKPVHVFERGPVRDTLDPGIRAYVDRIRTALPEYIDYEERGHWDASLASYWISSLCRLLRRARDFHHGGALLITPDASLQGLNVKYDVCYPRLRSALESHALATIQSTQASDYIFDYIDQDADEIPVGLYLDETVNEGDLEESRSELDGTIWFIALLTRVDGLVVVNQNLEVQGFGVEITYNDQPRSVLRASDPRATRKQLNEVDYNHFGTRHRSMMRYCAQTPGSVGLVISQDGDVRAITLIDDKVVMWENIQLQRDFKARRRRSKRTNGRQASTTK